ncbi:MAG TPA: mechanosensitive ion channel, partial [Prevotella sp.]|nr:mechanosensitive ion channel [Prevotella sp.]
DDVLFNKKVLTSACHIVPAVVIWSLMPLVYLEYPIFKEILERATGIYIVVMSVRTALVFIGSFKGLESSEERRSSAQQYFHTFCGVLRILMLFVAGVVVVAILLGKNPLTLFAGLGATSAVLMLVFKDTILGLAAGVRLTSNDMLHKGDWITVKSVDANGIVEEMSLTTVKVRNFDNTIVTISPATLVNGSFQNWIGMQKSGGRRVQRKVYFDFRSIRLVDEELKARLLEKHFATEDSFKPKESLQKMLAKAEVGNEHQTEMEKDQNAGLGNARQHEQQVLADLRNPAALAPTNLQLYRKYMEKYLRERPEVNTEMTLMVRQLEATQCGLPMEFYFFVKDKVWVNYEHILAEIMEHAYALSAEFGLKIYQQYPEQ